MSIKYAYVKYANNRYDEYKHFEYVPVSGIFVTTNGSNNEKDPIQPKDAKDFIKNHRYTIKLCACENDLEKLCEDMKSCPDYDVVKGYIIKLGGMKLFRLISILLSSTAMN